jgi:hypothetical protein
VACPAAFLMDRAGPVDIEKGAHMIRKERLGIMRSERQVGLGLWPPQHCFGALAVPRGRNHVT